MNKKNCNVGCPDCEEVCKTKNSSKKYNANSPIYQCAICGKNYNTVEERIKCEIECLAKYEESEKKKREEILQAEKKKRYEHIKELLSEANEELKEYLIDYDSFVLDENNSYYYLRYLFRTSSFWF